MPNYQNVPTYGQPILTKGATTQAWYRFFQGLYTGIAPGPETTLLLGASPYAYTAPSKGFVILSGGTVTAVQFTRAQTTLTGQTAGIFPLDQGDVLTITYSGLPNATFVPI
jgi:hypothetical protein